MKIFASESEKWALLKKLDQTVRLGVIRAKEAYSGYQAGLFAVTKDSDKDRLIFDSRPFNTLETPPNRWINSMGASSNLLDVQMASDERMLLSGTDLREFYYSFSATPERVVRNSLIGTFFASDIRDFRCYDRKLEGAGPLLFGLKTLEMGDTCASSADSPPRHFGAIRPGEQGGACWHDFASAQVAQHVRGRHR